MDKLNTINCQMILKFINDPESFQSVEDIEIANNSIKNFSIVLDNINNWLDENPYRSLCD